MKMHRRKKTIKYGEQECCTLVGFIFYIREVVPFQAIFGVVLGIFDVGLAEKRNEVHELIDERRCVQFRPDLGCVSVCV